MTRVSLLERDPEAPRPPLRDAAELAAFEAVPYAERIGVQSVLEALQRGAARDPGHPAIQFLPQSDPDQPPLSLSHRDFMARVTQSANLFAELGVGPNDVVSFLLPLLPESFYALYGAQAVGIANPVNPLLSPTQIAEILRAAGTKVLVALGPMPGSDIFDKVQQIRAGLPSLEAVLIVRGGADLDPALLRFETRLAACPADRLTHSRHIGADEPAGYFHTGGTTGTPKLVRHTHGNQVYQAWVCATMLPIGEGRTLLYGLPLFHVGGALTQALATLCGGGTLVVLSPAGWRNPESIRNVWRMVERYRPPVFGAVPTVLAAALAVPVDGADLSSVDCVSGGGSAIPVAICQAYGARLDKPVLEVYGMTETASVHLMSYPDRPLRIGSVGHAVPYSRVRVVRLDGAGQAVGDCAPNEIGVVAMAGPGVFSGYLSEAHNRGTFVAPGWVNSGDLGRLDEDGYLWLTGRAKDLIIRGGHNIDPLAIEEVFFQHPAVALAAVVGQPDARAGEMPVAFVQLKPGAQATEAELIDFARERTPERAAVPVALFFVDPMPLTAVGKIFKPALRWRAAERVVAALLADLPALTAPGRTLAVECAAHPLHGSEVALRIGGAAPGEREALAGEVAERLGPLELHYALQWL